MLHPRYLLVAAALLGLPAVARAEDGAVVAPAVDGTTTNEAPEGAAPPEAPAPGRMVDVVVIAEQFAGEFAAVPLADTPVRLHVVVPPHQVVDTLEATTDASGRAGFSLPAAPGAEVVAEITDAARRFSDPVSISEPGMQEIRIQSWATTSDPSVVFVSRLVTIVQPSEAFLIVQQVYHLSVDQPVIYRPDLSQPGPGMAARMVRIDLPEDAVGVQVLRPAEQVRHLGNALFYGAEVAPAGAGERGPSLVVQYSLKHENRSRYVFEQPLSLDTESISFVVPRLSGLARHPILDIDLNFPSCDAPEAGRACFSELTTDTSGMAIDPNAQVLVARGGRGDAGTVLRVETRGWPSRPPWTAISASIFGVLGLLLGVGLLVRERRLAPPTDERTRRIQALEAQRDRILHDARTLEEDFARGELLRHTYEARKAVLAEQLAVIYRGLREAAAE